MIIRLDCSSCGTNFDYNTDDKDTRCPRCKIMQGTDVGAILTELRKHKVPGQEPILRLIEILHKEIVNVAVANTKPDRKA